MLEMVFTGVGYGLLLSVMLGPAFFVLLETSISKGVKAALMFDIGVILSDIVYLALALLFFSEVDALMNSGKTYILRFVGGGFFIVFGLLSILKKDKTAVKKEKIKTVQLTASNYLMMTFKGFAFNAINPGVLFYWFTLLSILPEAPKHLGLSRTTEVMIYLALILITFSLIDVLKILGAKKLQDMLTPEWMRIVNLVLGIILCCFGVLFIVQGVLLAIKGA